ncbi:MAG: carbohydrate ABC transporter permease [Tyzzerella sp.]|nr:carbohydrate ABC transporter permease [Tyzzerella sp.]
MIRKTRQSISLILKILLGVAYVTPIILAVLFSFQPSEEIGAIPLHLISDNPTLEHFKYVLEHIPVLKYLKNTFIMMLICIPCQVFLASLAAYSFAFFNYKGKEFLFSIYLAAMMIPGEVVIMTNYMTVQNLGLVDTYLGMTITSLVGVTGIFMLRQNMKSLPKELWEAAKVDGCKEMTYFFKVVFPLSTPVISSMAINSFIHVYNAYFWPMLVTSDDSMRTVQIGMATLMLSDSSRYGEILAGAVLCMIIPVIAFLIGQDYIIKGMTAGAVKS